MKSGIRGSFLQDVMFNWPLNYVSSQAIFIFGDLAELLLLKDLDKQLFLLKDFGKQNYSFYRILSNSYSFQKDL